MQNRSGGATSSRSGAGRSAAGHHHQLSSHTPQHTPRLSCRQEQQRRHSTTSTRAAAVLPAVQQVGRALQDGANLLLQPLGSSPQQQPPPAPAVSTTSSPPAAAGASGSPRTGPPPQVERQRLATVAAAAVGEPPAPQDLSGLWVKVPERCDVEGYEAALDVLGLSGLQKVTARLIEGLEIRQSRSSFGVSFVTVVPFFKVTEEAPLDGGSSSQGRRDLRFGRQTAAAKTLADGVEVTLTWSPPMAGSVVERYSLLPDGCLCVAAETRVGDRAASSTTVYTRSQGSREQLLADSKQRQRDQGLRA